MYIYLIQNDSSNRVIRTCNGYLSQTHYKKKRIEAVYYKGWAYQNLKQYDSAIKWFEILMATPYTKLKDDYRQEWDEENVKNESARRLARVFIAKAEYDSGVKYLDMARDKYKYHSWGPIENYVYYTRDLSMRYAECFKGKREFQKAIKELEPQMMNSMFTTSNTDWMMDSLYSYYLFVHSKEEVKGEFVNAVPAIKLLIKRFKDDTATYAIATARIFNDTIEYYSPYKESILDGKPKTQSEMFLESVNYFINSHIYKLATGEAVLKN